MKIFFSLFLFVAIVLAVYPFLNESESPEPLTGLPWQIDVLADGSTQVFGLHIGVSSLADAIKVLGTDMELAIVVATDGDSETAPEIGNLEMYYGHYRTGLLSGKLVIQTDIAPQKIQQWRDNAVKFEYMASGRAKKHFLSPDDLPQIFEETISGLTFIPAANLDEEVILARFGKPEKRIKLSGVEHFLYPKKGLDIALHENSKEVLQYVKPQLFQQLLSPLQ